MMAPGAAMAACTECCRVGLSPRAVATGIT